MIVLTLTARAIVRGPMILTEIGMTRLHDGDRLQVLPKLGYDLLRKYPDNLEEGDLAEVLEWAEGDRYRLIGKAPTEAEQPVK